MANRKVVYIFREPASTFWPQGLGQWARLALLAIQAAAVTVAAWSGKLSLLDLIGVML